MSKGEAALVLPQCENLPYIIIDEGDMVGILDLVPATKEIVIDQEIARHFTVMALDYSDILCLSLEVSRLISHLQHLQEINKKYPSIVEEIFEQARFRVGKTVRMRKDAIEFYEQRHRKSGGNYNATDDLLLDPPPASAPQQKSYSDLTKQTCSLLLQSDSKPLSPLPQQSTMNLRQIDELSDGSVSSDRSSNSTKNSHN